MHGVSSVELLVSPHNSRSGCSVTFNCSFDGRNNNLTEMKISKMAVGSSVDIFVYNLSAGGVATFASDLQVYCVHDTGLRLHFLSVTMTVARST